MGDGRCTPRTTLAKVLVIAAILMAGIPSTPFVDTARSSERIFKDADDSSSKIDIQRVRQGHYFREVLYRVTAYEPWTAADLEDGRIEFAFNLDEDPQIERLGIYEFQGGAGTQYRTTIFNQHGKVIGHAVHRRPSHRSAELWFKRWHLKNVTRYRVVVTVETTDPEGCSDGCADRAPNDGTFAHRLRSLCSGTEPTIRGTDGDDTLHGTRRSDVIDARRGDDEITRVGNGDVVCGGNGNDVIRSGEGYIFLKGGAGDDRISVTGPRPRPCNDTGRTGDCAYPMASAQGGKGDDVLFGGQYHEFLYGGGGADLLVGRKWSDQLNGGRGRDEARGGGGDDDCKKAETRRSCEN